MDVQMDNKLKQEHVLMVSYHDHINIRDVWEVVLCLGIDLIMPTLWGLGQIRLLNGFDLIMVVPLIMDIILHIVTFM